ncbi:MarR family transcriptional regulator [Sphingosinicella sp.]|uniref:MarR family winged helix-turn-helix transcriptional regulator n=1 Tax=Sphingosinicella sp. TaxID=1917971 RepID=UPI0017E18B95|nr:MarR family transcriptional regulator [Sphingosinicella sp.]MBA4758280.1 MarR family transcriptional regulator [Sphingosinicella sp.]
MSDTVANQTLRALRRILRASELGGRRLAAETGLIPSQMLVLQEIARRDDITPGAIAAALQFGHATVTNILDRLETGGLVVRRRGEQDKRQVLVRITEAGASALKAAPDMLQSRFNAGFTTLPAWEQAMILAALERLSNVLGASDIDAAPLIDAGAIDRD